MEIPQRLITMPGSRSMVTRNALLNFCVSGVFLGKGYWGVCWCSVGIYELVFCVGTANEKLLMTYL